MRFLNWLSWSIPPASTLCLELKETPGSQINVDRVPLTCKQCIDLHMILCLDGIDDKIQWDAAPFVEIHIGQTSTSLQNGCSSAAPFFACLNENLAETQSTKFRLDVRVGSDGSRIEVRHNPRSNLDNFGFKISRATTFKTCRRARWALLDPLIIKLAETGFLSSSWDQNYSATINKAVVLGTSARHRSWVKVMDGYTIQFTVFLSAWSGFTTSVHLHFRPQRPLRPPGLQNTVHPCTQLSFQNSSCSQRLSCHAWPCNWKILGAPSKNHQKYPQRATPSWLGSSFWDLKNERFFWCVPPNTCSDTSLFLCELSGNKVHSKDKFWGTHGCRTIHPARTVWDSDWNRLKMLSRWDMHSRKRKTSWLFRGYKC